MREAEETFHSEPAPLSQFTVKCRREVLSTFLTTTGEEPMQLGRISLTSTGCLILGEGELAKDYTNFVLIVPAQCTLSIPVQS